MNVSLCSSNVEISSAIEIGGVENQDSHVGVGDEAREISYLAYSLVYIDKSEVWLSLSYCMLLILPNVKPYNLFIKNLKSYIQKPSL